MKKPKVSVHKVTRRIYEVKIPDTKGRVCGLAERVVKEKPMTLKGKTTVTEEVSWILSPNIRKRPEADEVMKLLQAA